MEDFDEIAPDRAVVVMTVHQIGIVFPPAFDDFIFRHGKRSFVIGEFTKGEKCIAFFIKENGIIADAALKMFLDEFRPDCSMSAAVFGGHPRFEVHHKSMASHIIYLFRQRSRLWGLILINNADEVLGAYTS